ncbi:MAG: polysaccharide biosynthesis/export family protein [Rhodobacteraceae bacterium]|nr:polysaccharide biosynthesis/export family protein [Paracoccaceae bacterium]
MITRSAAIVALFLVAGCTTHTAEVSRQAGFEGGSINAATGMAIPVSAANIDQISAQSGTAYLVGRGDVLQIHAIDAPELTLPAGYQVDSDGAIQVPFLGRVLAADRDIATIRADIKQRLRQYLPQPQIDLRVIEHNARQISVIGDVTRPSRQTLTTQPLSVIDAINAAGGFAQGANQRRVTILRAGREIPVDMEGFLSHGAALPVLRDGDVVQVGRAASRIRPEPQPKGVSLHVPGYPPRQFDLGQQQVTLAQLLASAGASGGEVQLRRDDAAYQFRADDARDPAVGGRMVLAQGDIVLVHPRPAGFE